MHRLPIALTALALPAATAAAQAPPTAPPGAPTTAPQQEPPPTAASEPAWSFSASAYTYFVPDDREYVQPTFTADRDWLHLELRHNYESLDTTSIWFGYNFSVGEEVTLEFTPMIGGVFGDVGGVAPGYKGTLGWRRLELYSEGEYVVDTSDHDDNFFYNWSELTLTPVDWLRFGVVTQRTRLYDTQHDIERGLLLGFAGETWSVTGYLFDLDDSKPTFVLALGVGF